MGRKRRKLAAKRPTKAIKSQTQEPELLKIMRMVWIRVAGMEILWPAKLTQIKSDEYVVFIKSDNASYHVKKFDSSIKPFNENICALKAEGIEYLKLKNMRSHYKCFIDDVEWAQQEEEKLDDGTSDGETCKDKNNNVQTNEDSKSCSQTSKEQIGDNQTNEVKNNYSRTDEDSKSYGQKTRDRNSDSQIKEDKTIDCQMNKDKNNDCKKNQDEDGNSSAQTNENSNCVDQMKDAKNQDYETIDDNGNNLSNNEANDDVSHCSDYFSEDSFSEEESEGCVDDSFDETYKPLSHDDSDSDTSKETFVENSCSEELSDTYPMLTQTVRSNVESDVSSEAPLPANKQSVNVESDESSDEDIDEESILRDIENPQIFIKRVLNSKTTKGGKAKKNSRVYNSYQYCGSCHKKVSNLSQHLNRNKGSHHVHDANPEIKEIREETDEKRKKKLQMLLRAKFNHNFNLKTLKRGRGEILLERRPVTEFRIRHYGPCPNCLFWFAQKLLKKHAKKCINRKSISQSIGDLTTQSDCLSGQLQSIASNRLVKEVFSKMQRDEVSKVVKGDKLITQLGNQWLEKNVGNVIKRGVYTSQILRLIGRFLIILRKLKPFQQAEASVWDYLKPGHFDAVVEACILTASPLEDEDSLKAPSNAIKLGYDIKRLLSGKIGLSIIQNDQDIQNDAEKMLKLIEIYWGTKVTKAARVILLERSYYAKKNLPLPEDIQRLNGYLRETISELDYTVVDKTNHRRIAEVIQAKLVIYNRRRSGEVQGVRLRGYQRRCTGTDSQYFVGECSNLEKKLLESQEVMTIRGKCGKAVPVILPNEVKRGLSYLADKEVRAAAGISSSNNYLFASQGKWQSIVWAYDSVRKAGMAADLQNPAAVTSTNLRKYMATVTQVLDLKESQMQWVLNHLGHTMDVHKLHYRATSDILERTQIAKILLLQDQGRIGLFKNKSLDDITLEEFVVEEQQPQNDSEDRRREIDIDEEPAIDLVSPDVVKETLNEAETFFEEFGDLSESKKPRKKPTNTTKLYWTAEEEDEIRMRLHRFFEKKIRPTPNECLKAIQRSQKENGLIWKRKKDV